MHRAVVTLAVCFVTLLAACSEDPSLPNGEPTEAVCPPADPPTYDNFAQAFMETYCTRCHDAAKTGTMRQGAPAGADFETRTKLLLWTANIDKKAAFGPAAENTEMPPAGNPAPTAEERTRLGAYLACETVR